MLGVHITTTTYGTWLPGDARGHWSPVVASDGKLCYPKGLPNAGDPTTEKQARKRLKHEVVVFAERERLTVADAFGRVTREYGYDVYAAAIWKTHAHWVLGETDEDLGRVVGRYKGVAGKAVRELRGSGSVWTDGYYKVFLTTEEQMLAAVEYVERHNILLGLPARPWNWIRDWRGAAPSYRRENGF